MYTLCNIILQMYVGNNETYAIPLLHSAYTSTHYINQFSEFASKLAWSL